MRENEDNGVPAGAGPIATVDIVARLENLMKQGEDYIWRPAADAAIEIRQLRREVDDLLSRLREAIDYVEDAVRGWPGGSLEREGAVNVFDRCQAAIAKAEGLTAPEGQVRSAEREVVIPIPESELAVCPFDDGTGLHMAKPRNNGNDRHGAPSAWWVQCKCGAEGPNARSDEEAIQRWNTRSPDMLRVERLTKALRKLMTKLEDKDETWIVVQDWPEFYDARTALSIQPEVED